MNLNAMNQFFGHFATRQTGPNYVTFTATTPNCVVWILFRDYYHNLKTHLQARLNGGAWEDYVIPPHPNASNVDGKKFTLPNVGDSVQFRAPEYNPTFSQNFYVAINFQCRGAVAGSGDIMTLCTPEGDIKELPTRMYFSYLFSDASSLISTPNFNFERGQRDAIFQACQRCRNLQYIKVGFPTWQPIDGGTLAGEWVQNVSPTGVFECPKELPQIFDSSHIPPGWEVKTF